MMLLIYATLSGENFLKEKKPYHESITPGAGYVACLITILCLSVIIPISIPGGLKASVKNILVNYQSC